MKTASLINKREKAMNRAAAVFLFPVAIIMIVFIGYPIMSSFNTSLYSWNGITTDRLFIGLNNWIALIKDEVFWRAFKNNLIIMVLSITIQIPIGVALATFLDFGGKRTTIFKILWFVPLLMSSVAIGFLFKYGLATNGGIVSTISAYFGGGNVDLLGNEGRALYAVIAVICWRFIPFYMVYFMAAYTNIPYELFEAAKIDGATKGQYFTSIALPLLVPAMRSAAILSMVGSLKYFDLIYVMTGGGPGTATELMATYMYKQSFRTFHMGYGATIASGMFILITLMALTTMKLLNREGDY